MTPERYQRAGEIYHDALALPAEQRTEYLARTCAGDAALRAEVESLLSAHADAGGFIESPYDDISARLSPFGQHPVSSPPFIDLSAAPAAAGLKTGQHVGRYEIGEILGAGGMGTVYRAVDQTLGREVAIKALAPMFRADLASLRRFEREARVLATLSHPNIATIYGFERLDGAPYLVLERVRGETLAERLARRAMPLGEALAVAAQIVAGLEEAHGKGIIHRDLKPSNVMLAPDGRAKLVDFGLAKPAGFPSPASGSADPITAAGVVIGTARYMSPEQINGAEIDTRADVWAFGCVLYEMLAGRPAFAGKSVSDVVAAVLRDDPDWRALPADTPSSVVRLLRRCLRRDPRDRLQHIGDARFELLEPDDHDDGREGRRGTPWWRWRGAFVAAALAAAGGAWLVLNRPQPDTPTRLVRLSVELPAPLALPRDFAAPFAVAPGGSLLVFAAADHTTQRLYVRELTDPRLRPLAGTEGAAQPFFSPDGAWVGFFAGRKLAKIPVAGGAAIELADIGGNPRGAAWTSGGAVVVAPNQTSGLMLVPDGGGAPTMLTTLDKARGEYSHRWPDVLPGGKWALFTVGFEDASFDEARIEAVSIETRERRVVLPAAGFARYVPDGRLLFIRGGRLQAVGFDPERLTLDGSPEVVVDTVRYDWRNGGSHLAASAAGIFIYTPGEPSSSDSYLAWSDRDGRLTRVTDTARAFRDIQVSGDGTRIATVIGTAAQSDLWVVESNGTLSRLSFGLSPHRPVWRPGDHAITVGAEKDGRWRLLTIAADGKGDPVVLFESAQRLYPNAWSPDGRYLMFQETDPDTGWDLKIVDVDAEGRVRGVPRDFARTPFHESSAAMSRDGRWVAYESDELDGVVEVYVRSFPDGAHKVRASAAGARWPTWDTGRNLHYWQTDDSTLHVLRTQLDGGRLLLGEPRSVWAGAADPASMQRVITVGATRYGLDPGGARFLVRETSSAGRGPELSQPLIVLGWKEPPPP